MFCNIPLNVFLRCKDGDRKALNLICFLSSCFLCKKNTIDGKDCNKMQICVLCDKGILIV